MCSQDPFFGTNKIGSLKTNRVSGPLKAKVFYLTSRIIGGGGGGHFANSETEEARTIKLCTVIAHYITSIIKQLQFLNSHCSIVCSYCFVVCLIAKNEPKMIKFSSSFKLNEIHGFDSPFKRILKT